MGRVPSGVVPDRPKRRATIRELAEYTGLSQAAVSYALRGMQVSAETEERVRAAAEELGYEVDPIARALARRRERGGRDCSWGAWPTSGTRSSMRAVQRELRTGEPRHPGRPTRTASPSASSSSRAGSWITAWTD